MFQKFFYSQARRQMQCIYHQFHDGHGADFEKFGRILERSKKRGVYSDVSHCAVPYLRNMPAEGAIELLEEIVSNAPYAARHVVFALGSLATNIDVSDAAIEAMERVVERHPSPNIMNERSEIMRRLGLIQQREAARLQRAQNEPRIFAL